MTRSTLCNLLGAAAVGLLAACGSDSTSPDAISPLEQSADVALSTGDAIAFDVGVLAGDIGALGAGSSSSSLIAQGGQPRAIGENCTYDASAGRYTCAVTLDNGLSISRSFTLFSGGAPQQGYDALTTDSVQFESSLSGTVVRPNFTRTVSHAREATLSGLGGTETQRTFNGTGTGSVDAQYTGDRGTRTYTATSSDTIASVVFPVPQSPETFPLSGSIIHNVAGTQTAEGGRTVSRSVSRRVVVTFNGTATVPMTVGTLSCTLNLQTHAVSCAR